MLTWSPESSSALNPYLSHCDTFRIKALPSMLWISGAENVDIEGLDMDLVSEKEKAVFETNVLPFVGQHPGLGSQGLSPQESR